jgi:hypothetical protein
MMRPRAAMAAVPSGFSRQRPSAAPLNQATPALRRTPRLGSGRDSAGIIAERTSRCPAREPVGVATHRLPADEQHIPSGVAGTLAVGRWTLALERIRKEPPGGVG